MEEKSTRRKSGMSSREKTLLVVFILIVVGMGWYQFVWQTVKTRTASAESRIEMADTMIAQEKIRAEKKQVMVDALAAIEADPSIAPLPMTDYNNYLRVLSELRGQLGARSYESISGLEAGAPDEAGVYRRSVTVDNVVCADYAEARALVDSVAAGPYRCMLKSVSFTAVESDQSDEPVTLTVASGTDAPQTAVAQTAEEAAEEVPEEPEVVYHTLLTFTVTYYEEELEG